MATTLGLSFFFHDSAAAIVREGQIVAAFAEERLSRRKHTNEFPKLAIEYCWRGGVGLIMQSVFSLAARREDVGTWRDGHRRAGGLKTRWTKPLHRRCAMGIEPRRVSSRT